MGQAKSKRETLRGALIREAEAWAFEPSDTEAALIRDLAGLPSMSVFRQDAEKLRWARMKRRECHVNVSWYVDNDPTKQTRHVIGWWRQGEIFVLHSVIAQGSVMSCITPQEQDVENPIDFVPDPDITWREEGGVRHFYRNGWRLPVGLRISPAKVIAVFGRMKQRLLAGMDPHEAMLLLDREAAADL